jgi:hypothetical protein
MILILFGKMIVCQIKPVGAPGEHAVLALVRVRIRRRQIESRISRRWPMDVKKRVCGINLSIGAIASSHANVPDSGQSCRVAAATCNPIILTAASETP